MVHKCRWIEIDRNYEGFFKRCKVCGLIERDKVREKEANLRIYAP